MNHKTKDILERIEDSSPNESSHELFCRLRDCAHEIETLRAALASLPDAQADERDREILQVIDERDRFERDATELAEKVGQYLGVDVGEWSSANDPIIAAMEALDERVSVQQSAQADERGAFEAWAQGEFKLPDDGLERQGDDYRYSGICDAWSGWQARAAAPQAGTAQGVAVAINLEGLREKLLAPRQIVRDEDGWLTHPDFPICDEDVRADKLLEAFRIEAAFVSMEDDVSYEAYEEYYESEAPDCSSWAPTPPAGNGWVLLEIYDTEDGPYAMFGRDAYTAEQERKKENTRKLRAAVDAVRAERAAAPSPDREQVREDARRVDELSMLIRQLVHAIRKAAPDNDLADRAVDYLKRAGLQGSPLRIEAPDAPPSREQMGERWCFKCGHNAHEGSCADASPSRECGEQDCPPGVDDGACKQCYGEAVRGAQGVASESHAWDDEGDHCTKCGDPAWCADKVCHPKDASAPTLGDGVIPADCDVRKILLRVVPGDGDGYEVYAKNVGDVENLLCELGQRLEDFELARAQQPQAAEPKGLTDKQIKDLFDQFRHRIEDCDSGVDDDNLLDFARALLAAKGE